MNTEKYYTPSIEEFYVGFEYEYLDGLGTGTHWVKTDFDLYTMDHFRGTIERGDDLRVKYLDKGDIESLGWRQSGLSGAGYSIHWIENANEKQNAIWLKQHGSRWNIVDCRNQIHLQLFFGSIKNKSEFKKLMQQLQIL